MPRRGPRGEGSDTKADILDAARKAFAELGFSAATIRRIAAAAGVDPSLVHHFFGTKADLYAACIDLPLPPGVLQRLIAEAPHEQLGEIITNTFFSVWDRPDGRAPLVAMLAGAMTGHDQGVRAFREFLSGVLLTALVPRLLGHEAELRASLAAAHLVGVAVARYVVGLEPLASAPIADVIALVAPRVQSYFD